MLTEGGRAVGVSARGPAGPIDIRADIVILSAGGQGTPPILQRSGIFHAGNGLFADPLWWVVGPAAKIVAMAKRLATRLTAAPPAEAVTVKQEAGAHS